MRNALAITWKEGKSYFSTPIAYVVAAAFLALTGIFFVSDATGTFPQSSVRGFIGWASFFVLFLAPILTMRLFAEEQKSGTLELLLTAPVRDWEVVLGKYLASVMAFTATVGPTLYYVMLLYFFGDPDTGPVVTAYLGLFLHGSAALAVGLMASSLSPNQIISAVVGTAVLLTLSFVDRIASSVSGIAADVLYALSINAHFEDFSRGVIDTSHVIYYLSLIVMFLFLTVRSIETRRWR